MPVPPTDSAAPGSPARNPARVMLDSPLAAATRARVYRSRTRQRPRERILRVFAMLGALLVHLLFLFGFVLGPAYQPTLPPPSRQQYMQVRLIEPPELPPPPPVRGTPPKVRGPRHQGHAGALAAANRQPSSVAPAAAPRAASAMPPIVPPALPAARVSQPVAATTPPATLPQPAPTPQLQPIPLAGTPPQVNLPTPPLPVPQPPKFQPERVRPPQLEGNRALPQPRSLALPELPPQAAPPIAAPSIALSLSVPRISAPASIKPAPLVTPAAPPVPELQLIALPAQPAPAINLQAELSQPAPPVPRVRPQLQAPAITVAAVQPEALPPTPAARPQLQPSLPAVKIETRPLAASIQPVQAPASLSVPAPTAVAVPPLPASAPGAPASAPATTPAPSPAAATTSMATSPQPASAPTPAAATAPDISTAPDATPQGSDSAILGTPAGAPAAPQSTARSDRGAGQKTGQGSDQGIGSANAAAGQTGGNQPGAPQGEKQGALGGYVELKPRGDTQIMNHGSPNIGYRPTRFDKDWTPEDESSIDTALRRAVEKTTVSHTFHLPRGVRVECSLRPLLPIALFGCRNADPPPVPVADKVYDRLHMAPANPVAPPTPVSAASAPAPIRLDNSALCATAHVAGAPPPPGCETVTLPVQLAHPAAASSSSWVPASDQFH